MSNPLVHAERSARKWGGSVDDYLPLHQWFDATKGHLADNRHRMLLHNSFGILLAEQVFRAGSDQQPLATVYSFVIWQPNTFWRTSVCPLRGSVPGGTAVTSLDGR
ncbi:MAG: hypothetical protein U0941_25880 [Planctomycetaceae bacterium]